MIKNSVNRTIAARFLIFLIFAALALPVMLPSLFNSTASSDFVLMANDDCYKDENSSNDFSAMRLSAQAMTVNLYTERCIAAAEEREKAAIKAEEAMRAAEEIRKTMEVDDIIRFAEAYLGIGYTPAGKTPQTGFDCSGFVQWVLKNTGHTLAGACSSETFYKACTPINFDDAKAGDLIFFSGGDRISHVGIYIGDGMMIHSSSSKGISKSPIDTSYWGPRFYGFGRYLS